MYCIKKIGVDLAILKVSLFPQLVFAPLFCTNGVVEMLPSKIMES